ncbi:zinc finger protein 782-like [Panonychus citri]|uniref:zinc finger protein 782-like n=1 Tax=Panonychus citri TaxID=50023 RepID=UPI002307014C|nr:zinc finger protein 782-like [Panonychus citri]
MDDLGLSSRLLGFKTKIDDAVALVPDMTAEEKLRAVQFWNVVSEKLQGIVNDSAADINALIPDEFGDDDLNKETKELVETIENSKNFDFDSSLTSGTSLTAQPEDESLDFPDIASTNLSDTGLDSPADSLSDARVNDPTLSLNLSSSEQSPTGTTNIQSTPPHSRSLVDTDANDTLSMNGNLNESNDCEIDVDQLSVMENESLHFSAGNVDETQIGDLTNISTDANVLYGLESTDRANVIQSTSPKQHFNNNTTVESSIQDSNSSLGENLGAESESSFISESGESLNIDRFGVSHVSLEMETDTNSLETLMVNQSTTNGLMATTVDNNKILDRSNSIQSNGNVSLKVNDDDDKQYTCDVCGKISNSHSAHTSHKWTHTKSFTCDECGAKFSTKGNLLVHQRRHTGEKPFACDKCPAIFSTKGNLRRHIKAHSGERSWKCEVCGSKFTEKKSLKVHMRRHTGERPYKCTVCNKAFSQTGVLQTHMALHLDERKYLCEMCGKAFRQRSQLRLHVLRHEGVKKWDCSNCAAKFLTKGDLERHFRIHTGERPYVCPLCGKTFTRQQSLNEHSNRHLGLKPYNCDICHKKFSEMSACYKHIKIHKKQQQKSESDNPDLVNQDFQSMESTIGDHLSQPILN